MDQAYAAETNPGWRSHQKARAHPPHFSSFYAYLASLYIDEALKAWIEWVFGLGPDVAIRWRQLPSLQPGN